MFWLTNLSANVVNIATFCGFPSMISLLEEISLDMKLFNCHAQQEKARAVAKGDLRFDGICKVSFSISLLRYLIEHQLLSGWQGVHLSIVQNLNYGFDIFEAYYKAFQDFEKNF